MKKPSRQSPLGEVEKIAPKLVDLTRDVLFGDVWKRPGMSPRDRSLVTIAALVALNRPDQLQAHIQKGLHHGITREELGELMTHLAFYCGWPAAIVGSLAALAAAPE